MTTNLAGAFGGIGFGLYGLLQVLDILLHIFALVLVLEPEGLVLDDLLLLCQIGFLRGLLRRHLWSASTQ